MWPLPHHKPNLEYLDPAKLSAPCWHEIVFLAAVILLTLLLIRPVIVMLFL
jgi:hypothetical protein